MCGVGMGRVWGFGFGCYGEFRLHLYTQFLFDTYNEPLISVSNLLNILHNSQLQSVLLPIYKRSIFLYLNI